MVINLPFSEIGTREKFSVQTGWVVTECLGWESRRSWSRSSQWCCGPSTGSERTEDGGLGGTLSDHPPSSFPDVGLAQPRCVPPAPVVEGFAITSPRGPRLNLQYIVIHQGGEMSSGMLVNIEPWTLHWVLCTALTALLGSWWIECLVISLGADY